MKTLNYNILLVLIMLLISGCAKSTSIPAVNVSRLDAEQAIIQARAEIDEAEKVGADITEPKGRLDGAEEYFYDENYKKAKYEADAAAEIARRLKEDILVGVRGKEDAVAAIERADKLVSEVKVLGGDVSEPEKLLVEANSELENENYGKAIELADQAYDLAREIIDLIAMDKYIVGRWSATKDCLWNIAGKKGVYNDPWKWKRIYIANRNNIKDPNLIYPRQILKIPKK